MQRVDFFIKVSLGLHCIKPAQETDLDLANITVAFTKRNALRLILFQLLDHCLSELHFQAYGYSLKSIVYVHRLNRLDVLFAN